ncbi:aldehyde dehydrogenase [Penicillium chermesinum]|uniref:aldehyde dehydrogenase (NAD(+)) n=1 Tax=Penicillium chermesinum TaxID=63820 RepID=A0A9W9TKZ0_9EURO|nr:aldehyde dehydrogenase [Penicillium chermesinum]KAJ5226533.1 aldehyde dehydrogenase [Penicillium chermesinum]
MTTPIVPPLDFSSFYNVINGELTTTATTRHGINPATEGPNPEVPASTPTDVEAAVSAAKSVFPQWAATPWDERRAAIKKYAEALEREQEGFARLLVHEQGKPLQFARKEIIDSVRWLREIADLNLVEEVIREDEESQTIVRYTPIGVTVGIVPWNYPVVLACGKIAPALITGNPIIIKPSPFTPYCALKLAELAQPYFPPGVFQALSGDDNLGPWLTAHPEVGKISFTGSTETGKKVMDSASRRLARVTLELGGNDAAIICPDVDIETAAPTVATLAFLNSGQICIAVKRVYVHESIYNQFRDKVIEYIRTFKVNTDDDAFMGPLQNKMQFERVNDLVHDIGSQGYLAATGESEMPKTGYFIKPTIEEPFGPVVPLLSWSSEDEVIRRVNDTKMGLGASVWSRDIDRAAELARRIEAGSVWINKHVAIDPHVPFAGHKGSGIGCEWGIEGLKTFCNVQALFLQKSKA